MAAASPASNNNSSSAIVSAATTPSKATTVAAAATLGLRTDTPPKSQRGQNKPKCRQCGNVARSRNASRAASLRQLSNSFAQFNNLQVSLRSRKALTRKDAAAINEWRLSKLKEYKERNIEVESEAFDRYMQNVDLLEEVFCVESIGDNLSSVSESNQTSVENNNEIMIPKPKLQLRSNSIRSDSMRMRIQQIVDDGLKKAQMCALDGDMNELIDEEPNHASKRARTERLSVISDLMDKMNKARNEDDLKHCLEMKLQLFNLNKGSSNIELEDQETPKNRTAESDTAPAKEIDYSIPKLVGAAEIDQETINTIDKHFSSLEHVEVL